MIVLPPVIGHRGAAGLAPENTLASFRRAAGLGTAMVEFDVRLSADGQPVVFHDDTLERTSDGHGRVAAHDLAALRGLDAGSWFSADHAGERIPTLDEALALCLDLGLRVNLELKPDAGREADTARAALARAAAVWPADRPPPLVSSFAGDCLEVARATVRHWPRGLLVEEIPPDWAGRAGRLDCVALCADHRRLDDAEIAAVRAADLAVLAYTVNDPAVAERLRRAGVAAVFSDYPGRW